VRNCPLVQRLAAEKDDRASARLAYLTILSRLPTDDEIDDVAAHFVDPNNRAHASAGLAWALLTSAEFRFNR